MDYAEGQPHKRAERRASTAEERSSGRQPKMNTKEAAQYCGLGHSTLVKYRLSGGGPRFIKPGGGRRVVYDPEDLDYWLEAGRRTSTSDRGVRAD